jgi:hypothetical protein
MNSSKRLSSIVLVVATAVFTLFLISSLLASGQQPATAASPAIELTATPTPALPLLDLSRFADNGRVGPALQMVYGPQICTAYGDPFSPWISEWAPGPYTYQYRVIIPADYPEDILRVELFDPDSINSGAQTVDVLFSQTAIHHDPVRFPPAGIEMSCPAEQRDICILETGELDILDEDPTLTLAQINPYWYVRTDANRGSGNPNNHGDGSCAVPSVYTPGYNTQTVYQLAYQAEDDGDIQIVPLASYTGQVGDGIRDNGSHQTDMRWVSPGADQPGDYPIDPDTGEQIPVPTDNNSGSFEIDLTSDLPNIWVDPVTGERHLLLDITTISGASLNEFHVWAGPRYNLEFASDANTRNIQMINTPGSHDAAGVRVKAVGSLPQVSHETGWAEKPLLQLGPEYGGQTIHVSGFDLDAGSQPPLVFSFDTLAFTPADNDSDGIDHDLTDWALSYGGTADDNVAGRCFAGGDGYANECDNQWITPSYAITIPHDLDCDYQDPDVATCTPFYGGTLSVRYRAGFEDAATLLVPALPPAEPDPTVGCSAFPLAPHFASRSVSPPGIGDNAYPDPSAFQYPPNPPAYAQFINHVPDVALSDAQPGYLFRLWREGSGSPHTFSFLTWNNGINASSQTLVNSLLWPGNTRDYTDHGDGGQQATPHYPHVVRGFVNSIDPTDISLDIDNWVGRFSGVTSNAVHQAINDHIDHGRLLRLPVYDETAGSGSNVRLQVYRFGLFRLHGHDLTNTTGGGWLLLEFAGWDDSCGQSEPGEPTPTPTTTATATATATATMTPTATAEPPTVTPTSTPTSVPELPYTIYLPLLMR